MNLNKCLLQAQQLAAKAKPFILKHGGKIYTGVFNQSEWVYDVYEDGEFMLKVNMKSPTKAKAFVLHYITN